MTHPDQSIGGKLVDLAFIAGIVFLLWKSKIGEVSGVLLLAAIAQARGAVGVVNKIASAMGVSGGGGGGTPSERPPSSGSSGSSRAVMPPETPKRGPDTFVRRLAIGAVREQSTVGWSIAAVADAALAVVRPVARVRGSSAILAVVILCLGCVR